MRSDRQSLTGWGRWDSGSTVRAGHAGRAQTEQSRTGAVGARLNKGLVTAGKLFLKAGEFTTLKSRGPLLEPYSQMQNPRRY